MLAIMDAKARSASAGLPRSHSATLVPFSLAIAQTAIPCLPWQVLAGVIAGATVLGLAASELPARTTLRRDPIEVISAQA
jgi:hypothetical protein